MKGFIKWLIRRMLYLRLSNFALTETTALYWVEVMKRWPAVFGDEPFRKSMRLADGTWMDLGLFDVVERSLLLRGSWDDAILDAIEREVGEGDTFVDVGANIGYFTLRASRLVGESGTVVAFEPSHVNLARLCVHVSRNRAGNVLIGSMAVGSDYGMPSINFPTFNNAGAATLRPGHSVCGNRVFQWPLDAIFEAHGIRPSVIKIDIEGYEFEALKGMRSTLERYGPTVLCELTESFLKEMGQGSRELVAFMEQLGYSCALLTSAQGLAPGTSVTSADASMPEEQVDVIFRKRPKDDN
jgi:FkbM family methyltransferase